MYITILIILLLALAAFIFLRHPKFGRLPKGKRSEKINQSPHYRDGYFQNLTKTPDLTEGATYFSVAKEFFFRRNKSVIPVDNIPSIKTDLLNLDIHEDVLIWFGHSSYFIQLDKKRILVDPVFSNHASPLSFSTKAFKGTGIYTPGDMPDIDYLFISHDHWDHLDYDSIKKLRPKVNRVICGLGTGEHLEYWGYDKSIIVEMDWHEQAILEPGFAVHAIPARHFSGRGFKRNQSLWMSYILKTPTMKIFIGGDSGYDSHFQAAGKANGSFDLVILENGQYDKSWKHIHMMPIEVLKAAKDLHAKKLLTVHHSKFAIANHAWDDPLVKITQLNSIENVPLITPRMGEPVYLKDPAQQFEEWWKNV